MKASIFLFTKASARLFEAPRSEFHLHSSHIFTIRPCQCYTIYNIHQSSVIQAAAICSKCRALRDVLLQITAITALRILSIAIRPNLAGIMSSLLSTLSYQHLVSRAKKTFACNAILNSTILNSFLSSGSDTFCFLMEHLKKSSQSRKPFERYECILVSNTQLIQRPISSELQKLWYNQPETNPLLCFLSFLC